MNILTTTLVCLFLILVLVIRTGLILFEVGTSRSKNAASAVIRGICDLAVGTLVFWAIGAAILLQDQNGYLGLNWRLMWSSDSRILPYLCLTVLGTGIVSGIIGERARFIVIAPVSALLTGVIIPVLGHWSWVGFLQKVGVMDVGGALPLHLVAATVGLVGALVIGPRSGKYNKDGSANGILGHNIPLMGVGTLLMLAGWVCYLAIITLMVLPQNNMDRAAMNLILAAMAGALAAMLYSSYRYGKPEIFLALLGLIGGMVSSSASCGMIPAWGAAILGGVAGLLAPMVAILLDLRGRVDDPSGSVASFGVGALVSLAGSPLLLSGISVALRFRILGANLLGALLAIVVASGLTWLLFTLLKRVTKIRSSEADEYDGLDLAEHDINAYPDFEQTMIKSYHLRQA